MISPGDLKTFIVILLDWKCVSCKLVKTLFYLLWFFLEKCKSLWFISNSKPRPAWQTARWQKSGKYFHWAIALALSKLSWLYPLNRWHGKERLLGCLRLKSAVLAKTSCLFQLWDANQGQPIRAQWMLNTLKLTLSFCKTDCQTSSTTIYVIDSWYNVLEMWFLSKATKQIKFEKRGLKDFSNCTSCS